MNGGVGAPPVAPPVATLGAASGEGWGEVDAESQETLLGDTSVLGAIHSFLFGDGAPGPTALARNMIIGRYIVRRKCRLAARELFPLLEVPPEAGLSAPPLKAARIIAHFRGSLGGSVSGEVTVHFPELATQEAALALKPAPGEPCLGTENFSFLSEEEWRFSRKSRQELQAAFGLGVLNLFGVLWMRGALASGLLPLRGPITPWLNAGSSFLLAYAVAFLALPAARLGAITALNSRIRARNAQRRAMAGELVERVK